MIIVHAIGAIEGWADQLAIRKVILIRRLFGWHGVERIFQIAPPARWAGKSATTLSVYIVVQRCKTDAYGITARRG
jgi:hypothetical protein